MFTNGTWAGTLSGGGSYNVSLGQAGDIATAGDFDGDGKTDSAVYRPSEGTWYIRQSSDQNVISAPFGIATDTPAEGDYDGDGKDDLAIFRASTGEWWVNGSTAGVTVTIFGLPTDVPAVSYANPK